MDLGVTASTKRLIKDGRKYDYLFPKSKKEDPIIHANGEVLPETAGYMVTIIQKYAGDTKKLAPLLKGANLEETCRNIWNFIYQYIQYAKDKDGVEQLRRPARSWADRYTGVDCDCYSIFIGTCLLNLGIPFSLRITKYYGRPYYQHVYIVAHGKRDFVIDPVMDEYGVEKEYSDKKDIKMSSVNGIPIQLLNGIDGAEFDRNTAEVVAAIDLIGIDGLGEVDRDDKMLTYLKKTREAFITNKEAISKTVTDADGFVKLIDRAIAAWNTPERARVLEMLTQVEDDMISKGALVIPESENDEFESDDQFNGVEGVGEDPDYVYQYVRGTNGLAGGRLKKIKQGFFRGVKKVAAGAKAVLVKFNPMVMTMRLGFLALLRMNAGKLSDKLKYGMPDFTDQMAASMNIDPAEHAKFRKSYHNVKKMFVDVMMGQESKLKKNILSGKRKHFITNAAKGLMPTAAEVEDADNDAFDEKAASSVTPEEGGTDGLGIVGTASLTAAAATAVPWYKRAWNLVSGLKVGSLFRSKEKQAMMDQYGNKEGREKFKLLKSLTKGAKKGGISMDNVMNTVQKGQDLMQQANEIINPNNQPENMETNENPNPSFFQRNKTMLIAGGALVAVLGVGYLVIRATSKKKSGGLSGVRRRKSRKALQGAQKAIGAHKPKRRKTKVRAKTRTKTRTRARKKVRPYKLS